MELLDAWQRRKQYEAKLLAVEIVGMLAKALNAGGSGSGAERERWVEPQDMLKEIGLTLE